MNNPDVTIIGAGPAGSAAAILLARSGFPVTLIEQHRFPRDKVCGECLSAVGVDVLTSLDQLAPLLQAGAVWLNRAIIHAGDGESAATRLPRPMLGVSRHVLDAQLLYAARQAGVKIRQPARCESVSATEGGIALAIRDLETNAVEKVTSSFAILADGKSALPGSTPPATGDIGIKSHWIDVDGPTDAIELFGCRGCYGGLAPIEAGRWNAAFSVPAARIKEHRGDIAGLFAELVRENRSLAAHLQAAQRIGPWLAAPLPRFAVREHFTPRLIPIGNAAAAMEPIGGEGMGLAMRSAELAVEALVHCSNDWTADDERRLTRSYDALWRTRRTACRTIAKVFSSPRLADIAIAWMSGSEKITDMAMNAMGKGVF